MRIIFFITIIASSLGRVGEPFAGELLDYGFFTIDYSCEHKGYNYVMYETVRDTGSLDRYRGFHHEEQLPTDCRKKTTDTFKRPSGATQYHRGHGIHSNLWDHSEELMRATNTMANVVPHEAYQNVHGLWRYSEKLTECFRDKEDVYVWLGNIWGNNQENDHFIDTHGVTTPDKLWKVLIRGDGQINAWIIPNNNQATSNNAHKYEVSIREILDTVSYSIPSLKVFSHYQTNKTWWIPKGCSLK